MEKRTQEAEGRTILHSCEGKEKEETQSLARNTAQTKDAPVPVALHPVSRF